MNRTHLVVGILSIPTEYTADEVENALHDDQIDNREGTTIHSDLGLDNGIYGNETTFYCSEGEREILFRAGTEEHIYDNLQTVRSLLLEKELVTEDELENATFEIVNKVTDETVRQSYEDAGELEESEESEE